MTFYVCLFALFLVCLYAGQILGLMIHCDNCEDLFEVRKYVYLVPIVKLFLILPCLKDCVFERSLRPLAFYLFSGNMSMIILCVMLELQPEWKKKAQKKREREIEKRLNNSFRATVQTVFFGVRRILEHDFQYM